MCNGPINNDVINEYMIEFDTKGENLANGNNGKSNGKVTATRINTIENYCHIE